MHKTAEYLLFGILWTPLWCLTIITHHVTLLGNIRSRISSLPMPFYISPLRALQFHSKHFFRSWSWRGSIQDKNGPMNDSADWPSRSEKLTSANKMLGFQFARYREWAWCVQGKQLDFVFWSGGRGEGKMKEKSFLVFPILMHLIP